MPNLASKAEAQPSFAPMDGVGLPALRSRRSRRCCLSASQQHLSCCQWSTLKRHCCPQSLSPLHVFLHGAHASTAILTAAGNAPGSSVLTPPGGSCADKMIISIEMRTYAAALATCVVSQWLLLLPPACTSSQPRRPWSVCPLASRFRSQLQELQVRLKRAILEYVILAGSPRNP